MASFEDDILGRLGSSVQQQRDQAAEQAESHQREQDEQATREAATAQAWARVNELGSNAARMLLSKDVPTLPIWDNRSYGRLQEVRNSGRSGAFITLERPKSLQQTGSGWHLIESVSPGDESHLPSTTSYGLSTTGSFFTFRDTKLPRYQDKRLGQTREITGIIHPVEEKYPGIILRVMESDLFMDAVAFVYATGRTYRK